MRLAYEQGLLRGPSISPYQRWALTYMMSVKRWFIGEIQESALKDLLFVLDEERWKALYLPVPESEIETIEIPVTPEDFDAIDDFLANLDKGKSMNGGQVQGPEDGWH